MYALLAPYRSTTDSRFEWLENVFLRYLADWLSSTQPRAGSFTPDQRAKMFLSIQTYKGLQITVTSVIQLTKFLLGEGFESVLTERFCQDDVGEYFGHTGQRSKWYNVSEEPLPKRSKK